MLAVTVPVLNRAAALITEPRHHGHLIDPPLRILRIAASALMALIDASAYNAGLDRSTTCGVATSSVEGTPSQRRVFHELVRLEDERTRQRDERTRQTAEAS